MSKWFYYIRVSTKEQNLDRQENNEALDEFCKRMGINETEIIVLSDKESGKNFDRNNYKLLKQIVVSGDNIVVSSLDRFGRNYSDGRKEFTELISQGVKVYTLDRPMLEQLYKLDNSMSKFMIDFLVGWELINAEEELKRIKTRQMEGIRAAKKKNVKFGRPKIQIPENFKGVYDRWKAKEITARKAMEVLNLKRSKFYSIVKEYEVKEIEKFK